MHKYIKYLLIPFDNLPRHLLVAFLYDASCFFYWIVVPLLFNEQGATSVQLALLQTICFVIYAILAPFGGKLADRISPFIVVRMSMVFLTIGEAIVAIWPSSKIAIYFSAAFWALSAFTFWPAAVGTVGKEAGVGHEARNSGLFAVCWSFGKAIGYAAGGTLKSSLGSSTSLYISIGINIIIAIIYPYRHVKWLRDKIKKEKEELKGNKEDPLSKETVTTNENNNKDDVEIPIDVVKVIGIENTPNKSIKVKWTEQQLKNKTYTFLGYLMQLGIFGTSAVVTNQYIKIADEKSIGIPMKGSPEDNFVSINFCIMYIAQTLTFVAMSITDKWTYKRTLFLIAMAVFTLFLILLTVVFNPYVIFVISFFAGIAAGFSYQTSTYYSLRASEKSKGLFVGISESVAALSNGLLPLFAALLSQAFNVFATIYFCIAIMIVVMILFEILYHILTYINKKRQAKRVSISSDPHVNESNSTIPQENKEYKTASINETD
ncbi:transporter, major facilitator family protein [Entamoeba histolytica HM-1:IMSS-B]|uniref:Transporter, major facilitator family n=6 Tax=Entamoeba histolytica TaxID=5759 RepID=C4LTZ2_ENTH1|nr:transporter, major facilitator family [Entamoeba histolytica HM-1:IMSS]EMD46902.1 transporter major facilitator family protein, putative [Entamoeba histolytica KU27]EMH77378.1 transporter, major facilitator family protein [Entamoeba histolytica HM-1:IMSS-B]EMS14267.1 transporter, major facilitator family protein [Entamoeba histolytica HM-3:IMSS]ENY65842.1 transporter, major facilitator family protein, putative [Entamoeba histolytica HM-1:IMSS-A]GAT92054.1 transporter major facilitator famil|eukprot:XP_656774.1 transporter, major facilitator family [Entamoeba histolytica HM-1:IMSS]